jgi:hypothetical protein
MEYWNTGFDKDFTSIPLFVSFIPSFHYSTLPFFHAVGAHSITPRRLKRPGSYNSEKTIY